MGARIGIEIRPAFNPVNRRAESAPFVFLLPADIQNFAVALLVGIIVGTYSSICIAPLLLLSWQEGKWGTVRQWLFLPAASTKGR